MTQLNGNHKYKSSFEKLIEVGASPTPTSFFTLHELTTVVLLFTIQYILHHSDSWSEANITESSNPLWTKHNKAIEHLIEHKYKSLNKHKLVIIGVIYYSFFRAIGALRMSISLQVASYFGWYLIVAFYELRLFLKRTLSK